MMDNPEFKKEMKKLSSDTGFKETLKKTQEAFEDPHMAAKMEARMEHMMKVGTDKLKEGAAASMQEAMAAMNDPAVIQEMSKMLKDPSFAKQLQAMANDPDFKNYVDAVSY